MRTEAEVQETLDILDRQWDRLMNVEVPPTSEADDIARRLNEMSAERNMLKWVLEGSSIVYQWVDCTHVQAFKEYIEHYHDQQEEALAEAANEHYQEWLDTAEPGDQYTISENDHSLDPIEGEFEVVHVDESEFGHMYQLKFIGPNAAMKFGLGWGDMRAGVIAREASQV
jgi:hypothetical protein